MVWLEMLFFAIVIIFILLIKQFYRMFIFGLTAE
jgi:hypothetical protein